MLTKRAKAYSSSYLQTVSLSRAISSQFILRVFAAAEDRKTNKTPFLEVQGFSKSSMLIRLKSLSLVVVVIGCMIRVVVRNRRPSALWLSFQW